MEICLHFVLHVKSLTLWVEEKSFNYLEQCTAVCYFPLNSCIFAVVYVIQLERAIDSRAHICVVMLCIVP